jgi:hypothetical protein
VNDYTLRTTMWHQLERWTSINAWEPASLAAHVLLALDSLLASLKSRHASHFILPDCNILCQTPLDLSLIAKYGDHVSQHFTIIFFKDGETEIPMHDKFGRHGAISPRQV